MSGSAQCPHTDVHFHLNQAVAGDTPLRYLEVKGVCKICDAPMRFRCDVVGSQAALRFGAKHVPGWPATNFRRERLMGLDCSHDAFSGAYSTFNRFRQCVAEAMGGSYPDHYVYGPRGEILTENSAKFARAKLKPGLEPERWYFGDDYARDTHPGLWEFFCHSDCDGHITPKMCRLVADELEALLPRIEALNWQAGGHIDREGGYSAVTRRFIAGCRLAASKRQRLVFG